MANSNDGSFDIRLVERNIAKGLITRKAHERALSKLKDLSDAFEVSNVSQDGYLNRHEKSEETEE